MKCIILSVKEDYTKHDRVIAKTQAEKFGFVFGDGLMVLDYKPIKPALILIMKEIM